MTSIRSSRNQMPTETERSRRSSSKPSSSTWSRSWRRRECRRQPDGHQNTFSPYFPIKHNILYLNRMSRVGVECEDCGMLFQSEEQISRHRAKFCVNSKYANEELLNNEFQKLSQGKNISLLGKTPNRTLLEPSASAIRDPALQSFIQGPESEIDREYRMLLREIGERDDLKNRLDRERRQAEDELLNLDQREKEVAVEAKRKDLVDVMKRRENLSKEEETLEKEIKAFERERREEQRQQATKPNEDFAFREGREAGRLAMQRRLLEEKKRDLEHDLKAKRREQEKVQKQLGNLKEMPIFIPDFKLKQPAPPKPFPQQSPQRTEQPLQPIRETVQPFKSPPPSKPPRNERFETLQPESIIKPRIPENDLMKSSSKRSNVSSISDSLEEESILRRSRFTGNEKTLFQSLNPKGKSDEDIFIESLVAQEYDALNLLAKIPKDSELYQVKLKQFQEMSRVRQELKDKIQMVRLEKVKREFQLQKQMTETEKANLQWLDNNRKQMLGKGVDIIQRKPIDHSRANPYPNDPSINNPSFKNVPNQFFNNSNNNNNPPSFNNLPSSLQRIPSQAAGLKGHRITVKSVRNYDNDGPLSVKLILLEDGASKPRCMFNTKYHDGFAPKDERNPYNPVMRNRRDENGNINFSESFEVREDLQAIYNSSQSDMYLWITLMEKDAQKLSNQPAIYAWYCFKVTHFGQVRQGTFTLNLYQGNFPFPTPTDMNKIKGKAQEEVVIELSDILLTQSIPAEKSVSPSLPQEPSLQRTNISKQSNSLSNGNQRKNATGSSRRNKQQMQIKVDHLNQDGVKNFDEPYFHQNQSEAAFTPVTSSSKISFHLAVSGLRTLPSSIGPLKLQINLFDSSGKAVIAKEEVLSSLKGDMYNPFVSFSRKIIEQVPSSAVLLIRITALNVLNYDPGLLGFAYFHLFYNDTGEQIETDDFEKYNLINGDYQLPVYFGNTRGYLPQTALQIYPKIPCASLLLSISSDKTDPPPYSSGRYNTILFDLGEIESRLFAEQARRETQEIWDYVGAYMQFKGVENFSEDQSKKLLSQSLAFNQQNINHLHNLKNMAEYNPSFGVIVGVDMLSIPNNKRNYYYFCSLCLSPPATYYKNGENDLVFLYKIDLGTSLTYSLVFADDLLSFSPVFNINTAIIIELMRVEVSENGSPSNQIETCAYSVLPLFDMDVDFVCVNVGEHELRMQDEEFQEKNIKRVQANLRDFQDQTKGKKKSQFSLNIRVLNGFFPNQYAAPRTGGKGKPLRSIFQNSKGFKSTQDSVKKLIETNFGVSLE